MSARNFPDWVSKYVEYASVTEAPRRMHFWSGVGAIAGALRRRVWIDMKRFTWYPSFYVIFVAPPGIVSKSTTADIAMDLLRQVPGIKFGPNSVTWQALVTSFAAATEMFQCGDEFYPMSPLTLVASELGSLVDLRDRQMVDLLIELWDGKKGYEKVTKMSGNDTIDAPWINLLGCTTPNWIAENMPASTVGGGLSSRCVFIYADQKERYVAYVDEAVSHNDARLRSALIQDLERIAVDLVGPYTISAEARAWGRNWYETFWTGASSRMDDTMLEGYAARKQTHLHKLAMVLSASQGTSRVIDEEHLQLAEVMLNDLETDMPKVFAKIGRSAESLEAERFISIIRRRGGLPFHEAYRIVHNQFPNMADFEGMVAGAKGSGQLNIVDRVDGVWIVPK